MAYATLQDLIDDFGASEMVALTDREDPPAGQVDTDVVDKALAGADAQINGYLAGRYALPLSETPDLVRDIAVALAIYALHRYEVPEQVREKHKIARAQLKDISEGRLVLDVAGKELPGSGATGVQVTDRDRPLDPGKLAGFI